MRDYERRSAAVRCELHPTANPPPVIGCAPATVWRTTRILRLARFQSKSFLGDQLIGGLSKQLGRRRNFCHVITTLRILSSHNG